MEPYYQDDSVTLYRGDCLDVLAELPDASVDAVVTDPPYGIGFMGKEWDGVAIRAAAERDRETRKSLGPESVSRPGRAQPRSSSAYGNEAIIAGPVRGGKDFQEWCEAWASECLRVLKPGGHIATFGGTRTWHRLAAAIEDAGFELRDSIAWLYGSGFPKSLDVSKQIDKANGRIGETVLKLKHQLRIAFDKSGLAHSEIDARCGFRAANYLTLPAEGKRPDPWVAILPSAEKWAVMADVLGCTELDGLFDAAEREVLGTRKVVRGVAFTSEGRDELAVTAPATDAARQWQGWGTALKPAFEPIVVARKPLQGTVAANVTAHGTGALNIDACRVGTSGATTRSHQADFQSEGQSGQVHATRGYRTGHQVVEVNAGRWPTNVVIDEHTAAGIDEQTGVSRDGTAVQRNGGGQRIFNQGDGLTRDDAGYGGEGGASRFFPTFRYEAKAPTTERPTANGVAHPTVKPLDLMRWLVRLVTPPHGLVLDPFAGSGTTAEACIHEHMRCITIEREADYLPLIVGRLSKPMAVGFDFDNPQEAS